MTAAPPVRTPVTARAATLWSAGSVVGGRYRLDAPIGAGAMGEVWRAEHVTLGTTVAVKLVDTAGRGDAQETLARFHHEARAAAQLRSDHVVQILDHGADGRVAFIAMELLEGESLEQRLARVGSLPPADVARIVHEMARAVQKAHLAGIVHRDLKPPNVFLARWEGREMVKVLDFGIAKILSLPAEQHLQTQSGLVVGTPAYMSPEQVLGQPLDGRSDLWQLGVLAFECVCGKRPFDGYSLGELFMRICSAPLPVPSAVAPVPDGFDAWFEKAARRDPAERFQTALDLAEALAFVLSPEVVFESAKGTGAGLLAGTASAAAGPPANLTGRSVAWSTGRREGPRPGSGARKALVAVPFALAAATGLLWATVGRGRPSPAAATVPPGPSVALATATAAPSPSAAPAAPPAVAPGAAAPSASALPSSAIRPAGAARRGLEKRDAGAGGAASAAPSLPPPPHGPDDILGI